VPKAFVIDV